MRRASFDNRAGQRVAELAGECEGILTTDELRTCGLSARSIDTRVRIGALHGIHLGIYSVGHSNLSPAARCVAAVKASGPTAFLSHSAALAGWGLGTWEEIGDIEVTVVGTSARRRPGIRAHRVRSIEPVDLRPRGCIRVTSPARTVSDMAGRLGDDGLKGAVRRVQGMRIANQLQLVSTMVRLGPRPGSSRLARILAKGPQPTRSVLEDVVLDLILDAGFAPPDINVPLSFADRRYIPDFRWPDERLIVEADSRQWHVGEISQAEDAARQAFLEAHGERFIRVTWEQAVSQRSQTETRLATAGAPRRIVE